MPVAAGAIGAGGGIASAVIGANQAGNELDAAKAARQQALEQWLKINVPDPRQQQIELQKFKVSGTLSPQLQQAFQQSQTGLKNLSIAPDSREAELSALSKMQDIGNQGGMDAAARQSEAEALNKSNANTKGKIGAIEQNFAARGVGGAGAELAAELQAAQSDADSGAQAGMTAATAAQQRALQAMSSGANIASTLNSQDYNQAASAATAQDAINRFNTQNNQSVSNSNVNAANDAQAANLKAQQAVDNANVGVTNEQEKYNKGLVQQQFDNQTKVAGGAANAENGVATQATDAATRAGNEWSGIGQSLAQGAGAIGQAYASKNKQEDDEADE